jgi:biopolymer transport protein ExbB
MLKRARIIPAGFLERVKQALGGGGRKAALKECEQDASPVANIFAAAIRRMDEPIGVLERHVEQAGQREVFRMRKYLRVLSVIASVTPLLGLLGTIFGMIRAFQTVATSAEALGRTESLAQGIYEAMITTAAGLSVAIPVLIAYHWVSAKIEHLVVEMDMMVVELVEDAVRPPAARAGKTETSARSDGHASVSRPVAEVAPIDPAVAAGT